LRQQTTQIEEDAVLDEREKHHLLDSLGDDLFIAELTTGLAGEMMIIALYKSIEIAIKRMAELSGLFTPNELKSFAYAKERAAHFLKKVCDLQTVRNFAEYDELRCINNCVKHSGEVNDELARYPTFQKGQQLSDLRDHYHRLRDPVDGFLTALRDQILSKMP
jgi:hypothetical protein